MRFWTQAEQFCPRCKTVLPVIFFGNSNSFVPNRAPIPSCQEWKSLSPAAHARVKDLRASWLDPCVVLLDVGMATEMTPLDQLNMVSQHERLGPVMMSSCPTIVPSLDHWEYCRVPRESRGSLGPPCLLSPEAVAQHTSGPPHLWPIIVVAAAHSA